MAEPNVRAKMMPVPAHVLAAAIDEVLGRREAASGPHPWTEAEMIRLAQSGVAKVDLLGPRGTTLCSMDEIAAMAAVLAVSGILKPPHLRVFPKRYSNGE